MELGGRQVYIVSGLAHAQGRLGRTDAARDLIAELESRTSGYVPASWLARAHVGLGDLDRAMALLEAAYQERDVSLIYATGEPILDSLRGHTRFEALLDKMGIPRSAQ